MKEFWNIIQFIFSALGGWLEYFLHTGDGLFYAILFIFILDFSITQKKITQFRKMCYFWLVVRRATGIYNIHRNQTNRS